MIKKRKSNNESITKTEKLEIETIESLNSKIKYNNDKIKKLEVALSILIENCTDKKNLYYLSDVAMIKADISNCKATIFLCEEKLKRLKKEESQPGQ